MHPLAQVLLMGSVPPTIPLDGLTATFAGSYSRDLLTTFIGGSRFTDAAGVVSSFNDQTGNARQFIQGTSAARPAVSTAGPNSRACADHDGTDDVLVGATPWTVYVPTGAKFIVVSVIFDTVSGVSGTSLNTIISDNQGVVGMGAWTLSGQIKIVGLNYPSNGPAQSDVVEFNIVTGVPYVFALRHDGTTGMFLSVNGGTEIFKATLTTWPSSAGVMGLARQGTTGALFDGKMFEVVTFATVPNATQRAALIADMLAWVAGSLTVDRLAGTTGVYSYSRKLKSEASSTLYTATGGSIDTMVDQSGYSHTFTGTTTGRPALVTAGPNSRACADFNGVGHLLGGSNVIATFFTASSGYLAVSVMFDTINSNQGNIYWDDPIIGDQGGYMGLFVTDVGTTDKVSAFNYDGTSDYASQTNVVVATPYVIEWKHENGFVSVRVNGGAWSNTASGNTTNTTGFYLFFGNGYSVAGNYCDFKLFEAVFCSVVPTVSQQNALVADMMTWVGATPLVSGIVDNLDATVACSFSRDLSILSSGTRYTATAGAIDTLINQLGVTANNFTATTTSRPTLSTAGPNSRACADFDGVDDFMVSSVWTNFCGATSAFIIISVIPDSITLATNMTYFSTGHYLLGDDGGIISLNASNDGGADKIYAQSYNGAVSQVSGQAVTEGQPYVITLRNEGSVIYMGRNGVETSAATSGSRSGSAAMRLGGRSGQGFLDGKIFEFATFNTVPSLAARNAMIADFMAHIGA